MANDPVLQRSMFQKQGSSVTPAVGLGTGIGSVTTPDQNAQALRNMFQPTVSIGAPTEMLQQPVQSFQEGGLAQLLPSFLRPAPPTEEELARVEQRAAMRRMAVDEQYMDEARQPPRQPLVAQYSFREPRNFRMPPSYSERTASTASGGEPTEATAFPRTASAPGSQAARVMQRRAELTGAPVAPVAEDVATRPDTQEAIRMMDEGRLTNNREMYMRGLESLRGISSVEAPRTASTPPSAPSMARRPEVLVSMDERTVPAAQAAPPPPPTEDRKPPREDTLQLTLKEIKAEREADRRQNAYLALMQAGLAIAGGRSPNAISNIGAGGQAGLAAFAAMERASREDAAARRRDAIQLDTARQQLALSERQLEKEPETIRTFRVLGGGDITKGFEIFNADKKLQAAVAITKDITASEEDRRAANEYIRGQLTKARTGGGSFSGFSATPVR